MYATLAAVFVALVSTYYVVRRASSDTITRIINGKVVRLPPGPRQLPIIGNIGQVDPVRQHPQFREWAQQYGALFRVRFGDTNLIVLNTAEAAIDLLDRRSAIYSSRNGPHFAHDLMSAGQRMVLLHYGPEWKAARTSLHPFLMGPKSATYKTVQEHESAVLMGDLARHTRHLQQRKRGSEPLTHETGWEAHIRRYTTSVVMNIVYGRRITGAYNNPSLHKIYDVLENFSVVGQSGKNVCDAFPIVRKLPDFLAPWRKKALDLHMWEMQLWGGLLAEAKAARRNLTAKQHAYVHSVLASRDSVGSSGPTESYPGLGLDTNGQMTDMFLAYTAATVLEAGSDTTASSIYFFVLACLNDPAMFAKLQREIDSAVPRTELPKFEEIEGLPYLRSCVKETLRRRPPTIMGVPHKVTQDDIYQDFFIPAGTTIIGNVWAIHMDPTRYPEPEKFRPERFLDDGLSAAKSVATMDPNRRDHYTFGWGRRVCQGMHIAENSLLINFARLAWAFDLVPDGEAVPSIDDEATYLPGLVSQTKAFPCGFVPRDAMVNKVLDGAFEEAQAYWAENDLEGDERESYYKQ